MVIDTFGKVQKKQSLELDFYLEWKTLTPFHRLGFRVRVSAKFDNYLNGRHVVTRGLTLPHGEREYGLSQDRDITFKRKK